MNVHVESAILRYGRSYQVLYFLATRYARADEHCIAASVDDYVVCCIFARIAIAVG